MAILNAKVTLTFNEEFWKKIQEHKKKAFIKAEDPSNQQEFSNVNFTDAGYIRHLIWKAIKDE